MKKVIITLVLSIVCLVSFGQTKVIHPEIVSLESAIDSVLIYRNVSIDTDIKCYHVDVQNSYGKNVGYIDFKLYFRDNKFSSVQIDEYLTSYSYSKKTFIRECLNNAGMNESFSGYTVNTHSLKSANNTHVKAVVIIYE